LYSQQTVVRAKLTHLQNGQIVHGISANDSCLVGVQTTAAAAAASAAAAIDSGPTAAAAVTQHHLE